MPHPAKSTVTDTTPKSRPIVTHRRTRQTRSTTQSRLGIITDGNPPEEERPVEVPSRDLDPPNEDDSIIFKALLLELPKVRESYSFAQRFSTASRAPVEDELKLDNGERLEKVVPCWGIMSGLIGKLREALKSYTQPLETDPFMSRLTVESRCAHLPSSICGEHDTEDWVHSAILRPAIAVVQYLLYKDTVRRDFPNISSVGGQAPIPDGIMFRFSTDRKNAIIVIEFKTHNVLGHSWLRQIHDKPTRVFLQLWGQMRSWRVNYMILSSYEHTYFFFKPKGESNTLYITNDFKPNNNDLLPATVAFMAVALGVYSIHDLNLPPANTKHWTRRKRSLAPGLDPSTFPIRSAQNDALKLTEIERCA